LVGTQRGLGTGRGDWSLRRDPYAVVVNYPLGRDLYVVVPRRHERKHPRKRFLPSPGGLMGGCVVGRPVGVSHIPNAGAHWHAWWEVALGGGGITNGWAPDLKGIPKYPTPT